MPEQKHTPTFTDLIPLATADSIKKDDYHRNRIIYIYVDRVVDGTKFQGRHLPGYRAWPRKKTIPLSKTGDISKKTIGVKLYAITSPSITGRKEGEDDDGKKKGKAEPMAEEAKKHLESVILHQVVRIKLLSKNKQSFAVCQAETAKGACCFCIGGTKPIDLSDEMARAGFASLYTGGGPIGDGYRENLNKIIKEAKTERRGMWSIDENVMSKDEIRRKAKRERSMKKIISARSLMKDVSDDNLKVSSHHNRSNHSRKPRKGKKKKKDKESSKDDDDDNNKDSSDEKENGKK